MTSPSINRLTEELAYPLAHDGNIAELIADNEQLALFFPGDAGRYAESNDVAVILPELVKAFEGRLSPAVVTRDNEPPLRERYPFNVWPSLVFLRRGVQIGTLSKVLDWADYMEKIAALLAEDHATAQDIPTLNL